jgi:excisionase family DNA binding protein
MRDQISAEGSRHYLTTDEAALFLRLSRSCLAKWRCAGGGPEYTLAGRKVLYAQAALDAWLASRRRSNTSERK